MAKDVIIACDFPTRERTLAFLDMFGTERPYVKIGMELFYAEGPDIVREIKARGHNIFLDLKLCDIPNTVKRAMAVLRGTGADMINLHAFGTAEMMTAALEGLTGPDGKRPLLIAVTQLTSTSEERMHRELLIEKPLAEVCLEYAENAMRSGARRRGLLSAGEPGRARALRRGLPHRYPRRALCRRGTRRPGACDYAGARP